MANGAPIKLTVIGGGSSSFVPALVRKLIGSELLGDVQLTLMDINEQRVRTMEELAKKLVASSGSSLQVSATLDRRESLRDADYVITTIAAGGMDAWEKDIEIPAKYGIVMHVADSIGPGGIMRALRNAPVIAGRCSRRLGGRAGRAGVQLRQPRERRSDGACDRARGQVAVTVLVHRAAGSSGLAGLVRRRGAGRDRDAGRGGRDQPLRERRRAAVQGRTRRAGAGTRARGGAGCQVGA